MLTVPWNAGQLSLTLSEVNEVRTKLPWKWHMLEVKLSQVLPTPFNLRETTVREKLARSLAVKRKPPCQMPSRELLSCLQKSPHALEERSRLWAQGWGWAGRKASFGKDSWKVAVGLSKAKLLAWARGSPGQQCHLASWSWNGCENPKENSLLQLAQNP